MKKILINTHEILCDDEDYDFLLRLNPTVAYLEGDRFEAIVHTLQIKKGDGGNAYLRHFLKRAAPNQEVLSKDGNRLNLQKENLVLVPHAVSVHRTRKRKGCSSAYKGIFFCKRKSVRPFIAYINPPSMRGEPRAKRITIGYFDNEHDAARAWNKKAVELYGPLAFQNKILA